jgi:hypothetical protein
MGKARRKTWTRSEAYVTPGASCAVHHRMKNAKIINKCGFDNGAIGSTSDSDALMQAMQCNAMHVLQLRNQGQATQDGPLDVPLPCPIGPSHINSACNNYDFETLHWMTLDSLRQQQFF